MSNIIKWSEQALAPLLQPKQADLINMIGEMQLKKEMSFAIQRINENSYLAQATPQSVAKAIWNLGITGLTLNPIHALAYITPRRVGQAVEAILMPSYRGLVKLLTDTGSVINAYAHVVYKGDIFEVELGTEYTLKHTPKFLTRENKDITHVYAIGILKDGSKQFEVMSIEDVNYIRERSDSYKSFKAGKATSSIWESDYGEMCRKTVIKRLTKYLPKTDQWEKLNEAIEIDNQDYPMTLGQENMIESLLETSAYDERQRGNIMQKVHGGLTKDEAEKIIQDLQLNQLNPVTHGGNPSQSDITDTVKQHT